MKQSLFILLAIGMITGCNTKNANQAAEQEKKVMHDIDKLVSDLPNPAAIPFTLKSIDAVYSESLVNSLDNFERYKGDEDKLALNMGVYAADVSYLACYQMKDLTMSYVRMCHTIGEILGDSAIFAEDLLAKIESSLSNDEALADQLRNMIVETSVRLETDHHLSMAALALTGSFIEELYQAVNVIEHYHGANLNKEENKAKLEPLVKLVLDQEQPLLDLIELLEDIPHDDTILGILTQLKILDRLYKGELATIEENMKADKNYVVDREVMFGMTLEIERIRESLVN